MKLKWKMRRWWRQLLCRHEETEYGGEVGPEGFNPFVLRCTKCLKLLKVFGSMEEMRAHDPDRERAKELCKGFIRNGFGTGLSIFLYFAVLHTELVWLLAALALLTALGVFSLVLGWREIERLERGGS